MCLPFFSIFSFFFSRMSRLELFLESIDNMQRIFVFVVLFYKIFYKICPNWNRKPNEEEICLRFDLIARFGSCSRAIYNKSRRYLDTIIDLILQIKRIWKVNIVPIFLFLFAKVCASFSSSNQVSCLYT